MAKFEKTSRGFKIYGKVEDTRTCIWRVQESSAVGRAKAYIFGEDPNNVYTSSEPSPHLNAAQAKELIAVLQAFVDDAEDPSNWRNDPEYLEAWEDEEEDDDAGG